MKGLNVAEQNNEVQDVPTPEPTRLEKFAKTSSAAKLSGKAHQTAGFFKRKIGEFTDDNLLKNEGQNQELLGKVHNMVGKFRELRENVLEKANVARKDGTKIFRKHTGKLIDQAAELIEDVRSTFF